MAIIHCDKGIIMSIDIDGYFLDDYFRATHETHWLNGNGTLQLYHNNELIYNKTSAETSPMARVATAIDIDINGRKVRVDLVWQSNLFSISLMIAANNIQIAGDYIDYSRHGEQKTIPIEQLPQAISKMYSVDTNNDPNNIEIDKEIPDAVGTGFFIN